MEKMRKCRGEKGRGSKRHDARAHASLCAEDAEAHAQGEGGPLPAQGGRLRAVRLLLLDRVVLVLLLRRVVKLGRKRVLRLVRVVRGELVVLVCGRGGEVRRGGCGCGPARGCRAGVRAEECSGGGGGGGRVGVDAAARLADLLRCVLLFRRRRGGAGAQHAASAVAAACGRGEQEGRGVGVGVLVRKVRRGRGVGIRVLVVGGCIRVKRGRGRAGEPLVARRLCGALCCVLIFWVGRADVIVVVCEVVVGALPARACGRARACLCLCGCRGQLRGGCDGEVVLVAECALLRRCGAGHLWLMCVS
ncbi:hypothetical protein C8R45DRAFT_974502 [Mycena sanguinolenta]|nr:hypothetical protein C8R45DRAFT_974502 [Mycena sanguinolenta]